MKIELLKKRILCLSLLIFRIENAIAGEMDVLLEMCRVGAQCEKILCPTNKSLTRAVKVSKLFAKINNRATDECLNADLLSPDERKRTRELKELIDKENSVCRAGLGQEIGQELGLLPTYAEEARQIKQNAVERCKAAIIIEEFHKSALHGLTLDAEEQRQIRDEVSNSKALLAEDFTHAAISIAGMVPCSGGKKNFANSKLEKILRVPSSTSSPSSLCECLGKGGYKKIGQLSAYMTVFENPANPSHVIKVQRYNDPGYLEFRLDKVRNAEPFLKQLGQKHGLDVVVHHEEIIGCFLLKQKKAAGVSMTNLRSKIASGDITEAEYWNFYNKLKGMQKDIDALGRGKLVLDTATTLCSWDRMPKMDLDIHPGNFNVIIEGGKVTRMELFDL